MRKMRGTHTSSINIPKQDTHKPSQLPACYASIVATIILKTRLIVLQKTQAVGPILSFPTAETGDIEYVSYAELEWRAL